MGIRVIDGKVFKTRTATRRFDPTAGSQARQARLYRGADGSAPRSLEQAVVDIGVYSPARAFIEAGLRSLRDTLRGG